MKEWIIQNLDWLVPCIISVLSGLFGCTTVSLITTRGKTKIISKILEDAKLRETSAICPHCQKRIPLSSIHWILPDGSRDDNLNGIPDEQEKIK